MISNVTTRVKQLHWSSSTFFYIGNTQVRDLDGSCVEKFKLPKKTSHCTDPIIDNGNAFMSSSRIVQVFIIRWCQQWCESWPFIWESGQKDDVRRNCVLLVKFVTQCVGQRDAKPQLEGHSFPAALFNLEGFWHNRLRLTWHNEVFGVALLSSPQMNSFHRRQKRQASTRSTLWSLSYYHFELWETKIPNLYFAWKVFWASAAETDARKSTLSAAEAANLGLESRTSCSIQIDRQSCWSCWWAWSWIYMSCWTLHIEHFGPLVVKDQMFRFHMELGFDHF